MVEHRVCDHYQPKLRAALDCVDAGTLWDESDPNAVGAIVLHMAAHLRGVTRMLSTGSARSEPLEEVFPVTGQTPNELVAELTAASDEFRAAIGECRRRQSLPDNVTVQRILHLMEHLGYHTGQVVYAIRAKTGREFRFAQTGLDEAAERRLVERDRLIITKEERFDKVKEIVREDLEGHFGALFAFDPIVVHPAVDEFGDGDGEVYLRILIIFDGDQDQLDPDWTSGLIPRIRPSLFAVGVKEYPVPSFIKRTEWQSMLPKWRRLHPEVPLETG